MNPHSLKIENDFLQLISTTDIDFSFNDNNSKVSISQSVAATWVLDLWRKMPRKPLQLKIETVNQNHFSPLIAPRFDCRMLAGGGCWRGNHSLFGVTAKAPTLLEEIRFVLTVGSYLENLGYGNGKLFFIARTFSSPVRQATCPSPENILVKSLSVIVCQAEPKLQNFAHASILNR